MTRNPRKVCDCVLRSITAETQVGLKNINNVDNFLSQPISRHTEHGHHNNNADTQRVDFSQMNLMKMEMFFSSQLQFRNLSFN